VTRRSDSGQRLAEVDYDVYAEGEAVLGWLNATIKLNGDPMGWGLFAQNLLKGLGQRLDSLGVSVGHVKLLLESGDNFLMGNLTGSADTLTMRGSAGTGFEARLTLNARVQMPPEALEAVAREVLAAAADQGRITATPVAWRCLSPGRPNPTHRYDHVVASKAS
jgi:hypothetical protein